MRKKIFLSIIAILICLFFLGFYYNYENEIHKKVENFRQKYDSSVEYKMMHEKRVDISSFPALEDEPDAWYTKYHIIAHAGGGIDGRTYTNSLEAWEYSYSRGTRVFDADCLFTSDSVLVLRHSWKDNLEQNLLPMKDSYTFVDKNGHKQYLDKKSEVMNFEEFMSKKIFRKYSPISCQMMLKFMNEHEDLYVATDMHLADVAQSYRYLVEKAREIKLENVLDRIIVNIYDYEMYDEIMKIYNFKNVTARQHHVRKNNYYELAQFCIKNNIHVVNVSSIYMEDEGIQLLLSKNIHVITAVVDYISDLHEYRKLGSSGCVSNFIYEDIYNLSE